MKKSAKAKQYLENIVQNCVLVTLEAGILHVQKTPYHKTSIAEDPVEPSYFSTLPMTHNAKSSLQLNCTGNRASTRDCAYRICTSYS